MPTKGNIQTANFLTATILRNSTVTYEIQAVAHCEIFKQNPRSKSKLTRASSFEPNFPQWLHIAM